jgi:hypothetical protein
MWEDPIVAEVHRTREKLAAQFNYDVNAMFADLMKRQVSLGARLVAPKKHPEPTAEANSEEGTSTKVPAPVSESSTVAQAAPASEP